MFFFKKIIILCLILSIIGCSSNNLKEITDQNGFSIEIETSDDKYNIMLKENLKRFFSSKINSHKKYKLNTTIKFQSSNTLSVSGKNVLKSTKASINYYLKNNETNDMIDSGSINTFPALSSSSNSFYTKQKSIEHIKERLVKSSAKSLYMHIKIIISKLS
tara:strand:+ start:315 stop:797 length:483 start_codon:yes stop_codon:yes gene_type:complete